MLWQQKQNEALAGVIEEQRQKLFELSEFVDRPHGSVLKSEPRAKSLEQKTLQDHFTDRINEFVQQNDFGADKSFEPSGLVGEKGLVNASSLATSKSSLRRAELAKLKQENLLRKKEKELADAALNEQEAYIADLKRVLA